MNCIRRQIRRLWKKTEGVTTVEYAVLLAAIILFCVVAITNAGTSHRAFWLDTADQLEVISAASEEF